MKRWVTASVLIGCAGSALPLPPRPDSPLVVPTRSAASAHVVASSQPPTALPEPSSAVVFVPAPAPAPAEDAVAPAPAADEPPADVGRCSTVPPLLPNGAAPPAPPHEPVGRDVPVPGDRAAYVLPGEEGDPRVIIYLPGMCGDATAADHFRDAAKAHGTLIAVRGDTECPNGRFKWRDDPAKIQGRIRAAFAQVNAQLGGTLRLEQALLFGYSQGADRAERLAALYPRQYPRVVLGGPPQKASPTRLARAARVAFLGGELETTENMRVGYDALRAAGITTRFFTLECAYHGWFGTSAESQLAEVLSWVSS
jgi:predicted esterase